MWNIRDVVSPLRKVILWYVCYRILGGISKGIIKRPDRWKGNDFREPQPPPVLHWMRRSPEKLTRQQCTLSMRWLTIQIYYGCEEKTHNSENKDYIWFPADHSCYYYFKAGPKESSSLRFCVQFRDRRAIYHSVVLDWKMSIVILVRIKIFSFNSPFDLYFQK